MSRQRNLLIFLALVGAVLLIPATAKDKGHVPTPSEFLGFEVGADRTLADYRQIVNYFKALTAVSDRVELQNLGKTTLGEDLIMAVISSAENLHNQALSGD